MAIERSCPDELGTHYEIPRDAYHQLHDLVVQINQVEAAKSFAATLQGLLEQVVCVIQD